LLQGKDTFPAHIPERTRKKEGHCFHHTDYSGVDKIINHLKLSFQAERPPPPQVAQQQLLMAAEESGEYF